MITPARQPSDFSAFGVGEEGKAANFPRHATWVLGAWITPGKETHWRGLPVRLLSLRRVGIHPIPSTCLHLIVSLLFNLEFEDMEP